ncbi:predicted protein [Chaetomium globosum CBS 148.51]|uniref:Ubiquitin-like protein smt3 n=1 Tax=Chaetomium globosum (strain ATCC 6205 / CBS 148.51 / DSM 1962 / NBRC 6347 / NRRL 1970) TaxID=306901 RepID=Q2H095_CHAGB|nr:uncharacterized protein CHGG_04801 [Chaetomium globosum CBS 148.51]EAQ88182.1 predicted protein [Chaetomium globosum CBS 148.51]
MSTKSKDEVTSNLAKLSLKTTQLETTTTQPRTKTQSKSGPVADSWEDEADEDDETGPDTAEATPVAALGHAGTSAPPPTPMSPLGSANKRPFSPSALPGPGFSIPPFEGTGDYPGSSPLSSSSGGPSKRPEKTDAVARRMIASALGMRAPKPTEEQRAYDRAVREKEKKRREEEKEQERLKEEAAAKARQAIWDD